MSIFELMTVISCVASCITMIIVIVAILPQMKDGMVIVRDAVLWIAMVVVVAAALMIGWKSVTAEPDDVESSSYYDDEYASYDP